MTNLFTEIENTQYPLWDYGWFDLTRFRIRDDIQSFTNNFDVIRALLTDTIYQRSFCTFPDPWGALVQRHGPFLSNKISSEWYRSITAKELHHHVHKVIIDAGLDSPPDREQIQVVDKWVVDAGIHKNEIFIMEPPEDESLRVEWAYIWFVFTEFICINRLARELTVAVIGYD